MKQIAAATFLILSVIPLEKIISLPLYSARAGRACDNCHASPFETRKQKAWADPELSLRKCNLSCQTCHVNPTGGGLRTAAGRYYYQNTLPMFGSRHRPYWDQQRSLGGLFKLFTGSKKERPGELKANEEKKPESETPVQKEELPTYSLADPFVYGVPLNIRSASQQSPYSLQYGRYGELNADPLVNVGFDGRLAYLNTIGDNKDGLIFPMQSDFAVAVHPVEHLTTLATVGVLGQKDDTVKTPLSKRIIFRDAVVMAHELPFQSYAKAGIFKPNFGTNIEDHTAAVRSEFDLNTSRVGNSVLGAEIGAAPNYPYVNTSVFYDLSPDNSIRGQGATFSAGWRDLGFGGGMSLMTKSRPAGKGGDLNAVAFNSYFNPFRWSRFIPLTILDEIAFGKKTDPSGVNRPYLAWFVEGNVLIVNGLNFRMSHYYLDENLEITGNATARIGIGGDFIPLPYIRLTMEYRVSRDFDTGVVSNKDLLFLLHGFF